MKKSKEQLVSICFSVIVYKRTVHMAEAEAWRQALLGRRGCMGAGKLFSLILAQLHGGPIHVLLLPRIPLEFRLVSQTKN